MVLCVWALVVDEDDLSLETSRAFRSEDCAVTNLEIFPLGSGDASLGGLEDMVS